MGILVDRRLFLFGTGALAVGAIVRPAEASDLVVVVNKSVGQRTFSKSELAAIFSTKKRNYAGGGHIIPFNLPPRDPARVEFDRKILGMTPDQVARYWVDRRVRGGNSPPKHVPSPALVARLVEKLPNAIGYVPASLAKNLKIVARV